MGQVDRASFYVTTYCNFAHRLSDGKPIEHECRIIPPSALMAEMEGDYEEAMEILHHTPSREHRGVRHEKEEEPAESSYSAKVGRGVDSGRG